VAAAIRDQLGLDAAIEKGSLGEFSVWVGEVRVSGRNWLGVIPSDGKIVGAVASAVAGERSA